MAKPNALTTFTSSKNKSTTQNTIAPYTLHGAANAKNLTVSPNAAKDLVKGLDAQRKDIQAKIAEAKAALKGRAAGFNGGQLYYYIKSAVRAMTTAEVNAYISKLNAQLATNTKDTAKAKKIKTSGKGNNSVTKKVVPDPKPFDPYAKAVKYNAKAVSEAYFRPNQSFFHSGGTNPGGWDTSKTPASPVAPATGDWNDNPAEFDKYLYANNNPAAITEAKALWSSVTTAGSKGVIQSWKPPTNEGTFLNTDGGWSDFSSKKAIQRYGMQFLYNPDVVTMHFGGVADIDPLYAASGQDPFVLTNTSVYQSSITFNLVLNRMYDLKYIGKNGELIGKTTDAELWPAGAPSLAERKEIYELGTMYDIGYLLKALSRYEINSQFRGKTADMGYLGGQPVELHLGNKLRYVVQLESFDVVHKIFDNRMVPLLSSVSITAKRIPDYNVGTTNANSSSSAAATSGSFYSDNKNGTYTSQGITYDSVTGKPV